jgi:hypothetical protein
MTQNVENEPGLAPSAESQTQKAEKVRAGKGLAGVVGIIAAMFLVGFVIIIVGSLVLGLHIL